MGKSHQQRLGFAESIEPRFLKTGLGRWVSTQKWRYIVLGSKYMLNEIDWRVIVSSPFCLSCLFLNTWLPDWKPWFKLDLFIFAAWGYNIFQMGLQCFNLLPEMGIHLWSATSGKPSKIDHHKHCMPKQGTPIGLHMLSCLTWHHMEPMTKNPEEV